MTDFMQLRGDRRVVAASACLEELLERLQAGERAGSTSVSAR